MRRDVGRGVGWDTGRDQLIQVQGRTVIAPAAWLLMQLVAIDVQLRCEA